MIDCGQNSKIGILVVSCDAYSDLWNPFFALIALFWPDCPYPIYLCSNYKTFDANKVISLPIGDDVSWSGNLRKALSQINENYVLLFLDDLLLTAPVNTKAVQEVSEWFIGRSGNCVRMNPSPAPDYRLKGSNVPVGIGQVSAGTIYRASTVLTLWNKRVLCDLLEEGESAWDFEIYGSVRADAYGGFYASKHRHFEIVNSVIKGKWIPSVVPWLSQMGIVPDANRSIMDWPESVIYKFKTIRSILLGIVPAKMRRNLKHFLLRGKYSYTRHK